MNNDHCGSLWVSCVKALGMGHNRGRLLNDLWLQVSWSQVGAWLEEVATLTAFLLSFLPTLPRGQLLLSNALCLELVSHTVVIFGSKTLTVEGMPSLSSSSAGGPDLFSSLHQSHRPWLLSKAKKRTKMELLNSINRRSYRKGLSRPLWGLEC